MARMSNRDRIAKAAEEARLAAEEKAAKKAEKAEKAAAKPASKAPSRSRSKEVRMKVVWAIYNASGKAVKVFAYPDKDAAASEVQRLSSSTGQHHELRATKVPMD